MKNITVSLVVNPDLDKAQGTFALINLIKAMASNGFYYEGDYRKTRRKIRNLNKRMLHELRGDF